MRYPASEKLEIIPIVEQSHLPAKRTLDQLGIARRTFYLYGRLSLCKLISKRSAWISCKHLSGVSWFPRAPKWGIRTRAPLQLVGLAGLDKSQVRRASARSVQSISPSTRKLVRSSGGGAVVIARSKHGPDYPCVLVGDGNRCAVEAASLPKLVGPLAHGVVLVGSRSHNGTGAVNQQTTQMLASSFGDAHEYGLVAARKLARHQPEPSGHMATISEV